MKRNLFFYVLLMAYVVMIIPYTAFGQPNYGGTFTLAVHADFRTVDPHKAQLEVEWQSVNLFCESLLFLDKNWAIMPGLAESFDVSEDGLEYTFHLRKGVKFHNGREMTAEDVKWNLERIVNPKTGAISQSRYRDVKNVQVVDPYTVKFILNENNAAFLAGFGYGSYLTILAPESVNKDGNVTSPIGTGPFQLVEWKQGDYTKFKKFKDYWKKGLPYLDEIIFKPIIESTTRLIAIKTGKVDMAVMLSRHEVAEEMKKPHQDYILNLDAAAEGPFIYFNCAKPPFDDVRVRQAIHNGINKQDILMGVYNEMGEVRHQIFAKGSPWHSGDLPALTRNVKKAKALLKEAGYPNGLEVTMQVASIQEWVAIAQIVKEQLRDIGIDLKLDILEYSALSNLVDEKTHTISIDTWPPPPDPEHMYGLVFVPSGAYSHLVGSVDITSELSKLIEEGKREVDLDKRRAIYDKVAKIINKEAPFIWLAALNNPVALRSHVKGFEPNIRMLYAYGNGGLPYTWIDR